MRHGGFGQTEQASAAGSGPGGTQAVNTQGITGLAGCYDPAGSQRTDQKPFDPDERSAAMFGKGTFGKNVHIYRLDDGGKVISQAMNVEVNDTGPFARDAKGRLVRPLQPDPTRVIDLTPKVYRELTGFSDCYQGPGVIMVRVEWK